MSPFSRDPLRNALIFAALIISSLAMLLSARPARGQSTFGVVRGTVTDNQGSVIPSATVKLVYENENTAREFKTDSQGNYEALNLKAGRYSVTVQKEGFKETALKDLLLDARQVLRADVVLQPGQVNETITVDSGAALITTETQTIASSFDSQKVLNLPANYRGNGSTSPYRLLAALPGVQSDNGFGFSIQGALPHQTEVSVDGISTVNITTTGRNATISHRRKRSAK